LRVGNGTLEPMLARRKPGDKVTIHAFRRDELMCFEVTLAPAPANSVKLSARHPAAKAAVALRKGWLGR
ncbi:peptidase M61, partial [Azoarcus taiwanensis]|nr:peptidase M61 [Azoarcus taiwanensis]